MMDLGLLSPSWLQMHVNPKYLTVSWFKFLDITFLGKFTLKFKSRPVKVLSPSWSQVHHGPKSIMVLNARKSIEQGEVQYRMLSILTIWGQKLSFSSKNKKPVGD